LDAVIDLVVDPGRLRAAAVAIGVVLLLWLAVVVSCYVLVRPPDLRRWQEVLGGAVVAAACVALALPVATASRYATVQADLVTHVFEHNETATIPHDVTVKDPWGGRDRVSVLLLGGDGDVGRDGIRTDSVILLSIDIASGDSVMFSLPRNMMNAQFPADSPLHQIYPEGFRGDGDPAFWMLNAIYGQVPALHPGILGKSDNEGADAVKQAVEGSLGVPVDYYVLVNLSGFREIVDAMGGVTVNINEPIAIQGDTDRGIPPVGYLQPGPNQRLTGYEALWFTRGRWGSDDYERMLRQRCMIKALVDEAKPFNLLRRYQDLAEAGQDIVRTDVPSHLLSAFVDLVLRMKGADIESLPFVSSEEFFPGDPDFAWMQQVVQKALAPPDTANKPGAGGPPASPGPGEPTETPGSDDPGTAVSVEDSCGYNPVP
jgi:LCP family protein required for cell wall assembly